jgi:hypothetical protein
MFESIDQIQERMDSMIDALDEQRLERIEVAYMAAGFPHPKYAITASRVAGRLVDVTSLMAQVTMSVTMHCLANGLDMAKADTVAKAAKYAALALATEDLLGTVAYSTKEYGTLIDPWFKGFGIEDEKGKAA